MALALLGKNQKTVTIEVTGPKDLLGKTGKITRRAEVNMKWEEFLKDVCKLKLGGVKKADLQIGAANYDSNGAERKVFSLTSKVQRFVEECYKRRPPGGIFRVRLTKKRASASAGERGRNSGGLPLPSTSVAATGSARAALKRSASRATVVITPTQNVNLDDDSSSSTSEEDEDEQSEPTPRRRKTPHGVAAPGGSTGPKVKKERTGRHLDLDLNWDSESMIETRHAGITSSTAVKPIVKENLKSLSNSVLLRAKNEMTTLQTSRDVRGMPLWDQIAQRAPLCQFLLIRLFEERTD